MNKTKAREKAPVASIHLKHDFNLARYLDIWIQNLVSPIQDHLRLELAAAPRHDDSLCEALKLHFDFIVQIILVFILDLLLILNFTA